MLKDESEGVCAQARALFFAQGAEFNAPARYLGSAAEHLNGARVYTNNAGERVQKRGFSGTGGSHNGHGFAGVNIERNIAQYCVLSVGFGKVAHRDNGCV